MKACEHCSCSFKAKGNTRFCSEVCKREAWLLKNREYQKTYYSKNKAEMIAKRLARYYADHEGSKEKSRQRTKTRCKLSQNLSYIKWKYGLSKEEYEAMLSSQTNLCAICKQTGRHIRFDKLCVDHDHSTGKVRGLLCGKCNSAIGLLADNPELLRAAADYLEKHHKNSTTGH